MGGQQCQRCHTWIQDGPAGGLAEHTRTVHTGGDRRVGAPLGGRPRKSAAALEADRVRRRKEAAARSRANKPPDS